MLPAYVNGPFTFLMYCPCQVHEEVLRLLAAAAARLPMQQLSSYLATALHNSRRSRRRAKRRRPEDLGDVPGEYLGYSSSGGGGWASSAGYAGGFASEMGVALASSIANI